MQHRWYIGVASGNLVAQGSLGIGVHKVTATPASTICQQRCHTHAKQRRQST